MVRKTKISGNGPSSAVRQVSNDSIRKDSLYKDKTSHVITDCISEISVHHPSQRHIFNIKNGKPLEDHSPAYHSQSALTRIKQVLQHTFLPVGYPDSVRPEYLTYQLWDSIQGISSYLRSVLTTRAVLTGVGVGSAEVTPMSAALAWVLKDGFGMIGSLTFAYLYAESFEVYTKEWRLLADVLNNIGLTLDLISSLVPHRFFFPVTCLSMLSKSFCGLIAGATKARISAHFARTGHLADVTVKEGTQETAVALCGLVLGTVLARVIGTDEITTWFDTINPQRCCLLTQCLLEADKLDVSDNNDSDIMVKAKVNVSNNTSPQTIAARETFTLPFYLSFYGPQLGVSMQVLLEGLHCATSTSTSSTTSTKQTTTATTAETSALFDKLQFIWHNERFVVGLSKSGRVIVCLQESCSDADVVKSLFISHYLHIRLRVSAEKGSGLSELYVQLLDLVPTALCWHDEVVLRSVTVSGGEWNLSDMSSIKVGEWRYSAVDVDSRPVDDDKRRLTEMIEERAALSEGVKDRREVKKRW